MRQLLILAAVFCMSYAQHACRMEPILDDCQDQTVDCVECMTAKDCRMKCEEDPLCKGFNFHETRERCNLWHGKKCGEQKRDTLYWEKKCGSESSFDIIEKTKAIENDEYEYKPSCPKSCPAIEVPRNMYHNLLHTNVGSKVTFFCREGSLVGSRKITCRSDGSWSDEPPRCIPKE